VLLVNNAGFGTRGLFWEQVYETQRRMHELHITATLRLTHAALNNLVPRDTGAVINVASVSAFVRIAGTTSYAATKSWMTAFTEGLHVELKTAGSRVAVQALCPGYTYSGFQQAMGVDQKDLAGEGHWMTSEYVVEASLEGLRRGKLFVIPNWRYRLITAFLSKLPSTLRLLLEERVSQTRAKRVLPSARPSSSLPESK
jgi:short-subunit dehydrogenase